MTENAKTRNQENAKQGERVRSSIFAISHFRVFAFSIVFLATYLFSALPVNATSPLPKERRETRYGIFFLGQRIGTSTVIETPVQFRGQPALKVESASRIRIAALGEVEQQVDLTQYLDAKWAPIHLIFNMLSGGTTTRVLAEFHPTKVECEVGTGSAKSKKSVPIPKGASLIADPQLLGGQTLKVGQKQKFHLFEPLTLQVLPLDLEVLREEKLTLDGKSHAALVVKTVNGVTGEATSWVTESGDLLQGESALGIRMVRESGAKELAPAVTKYQPPVDLAIATAVRTEKKILSPRGVGYLRARIGGIPEQRLILSDARQRATVEGTADATGSFTALYTVNTEAATPAPDPGYRKRKPTGDPSPADERTYLEDAPYLNLDEAQVQARAKEIVGTETDAGKKAEKIRAWVHTKMTPDTSIGVPRGAADVLGKPRGVCRDYAVLFAALARASGIPTRVVAGIVYFNDGFYYHAWNECRTGPDTWRTFDATLPSDFVDATHIKFAQGDPTEMFQAVRVVGRLKVEVIEYR
jgi:hypothetical protein